MGGLQPLYKRETGSRTIWYVRFWHEDTQSYGSGRSTGQETRPAANRVAQKWLAEGIPEVKRKDFKVAKNRLMGAIKKHLEDTEIIKKGEIHEPGGYYAQLVQTFHFMLCMSLGKIVRNVRYSWA